MYIFKLYLETNGIIPVVQLGFPSGHGTHTALMYLASAMDKSCPSVLVLLDQSKAFDSVNY